MKAMQSAMRNPLVKGIRVQVSGRLGGAEILLLSPAADSFDGRYFGPSARRDVIGKARLLWAPGGGKTP